MIDIGKLYCDGTSTGDGLRYGTESKADAHGNAPHRVEKDALKGDQLLFGIQPGHVI
jgi:hypothetical protein